MKKILSIIIIAAAAFASCTSEESIEPDKTPARAHKVSDTL